MKSIITNKFSIALAILTFTLCSCSTFHYNHPRVKVDANRTQDIASSKPSEKTTSSQIQDEPEAESVLNSTEVSSTEVTPVLDSKVQETKIPVAKTANAVKAKTDKTNKINLFTYTKKLVSESKLMKVKNVEKSAISGWLRLFIIFLVVGFVLVIVGVVLSVVLPGPVWWLFYLFGALMIFAALIFLILGLVGVMA